MIAVQDIRCGIYATYISLHLSTRYPRAQVPKRLPLNYARGEVLESLLDPYLRAALQKGVPPLFTDLRSLYDDPERVGIIEKLMNRYLANLEETGHLCEEGEFSRFNETDLAMMYGVSVW